MTSAAGILITTNDGLALFLKRGAGSDHAGTWALPAGRIEDGETPEDAARRETLEEIGYTPEGQLSEIDNEANDEVEFTTFHHGVGEHFLPQLNIEHTAYAWAPLSDPPTPLHPGVADTIAKVRQSDEELGGSLNGAMDGMAFDRASVRVMRAASEGFAFDRASVRRTDADGRLHVERSHISKANVCPYLGREIPKFVELGLEPDHIYYLYRDPEELAKAAPTFNNIPVLSEHVEVNSLDHRPDLIVGTTGSEAVVANDYLDNSIAVWVQDAIDDVETERKKELSSAYRYRADMTPGTVKGVRFDGVMRDIIGNHVALVKEGRAGPDVVVGDSKEEINKMAKGLAVSQKALMARGALAVFLQPRLAADAKMPSLATILIGVNAKNFKDKKTSLITAIDKAVKPLLAKDASTEGLAVLLDALGNTPVADDMGPEDDVILDAPPKDNPDVPPKAEGEGDPPPAPVDAPPPKPDPIEAIKSFLAGKLSPEDMAEIEKLCVAGAMDAPPPTPGTPPAPGAVPVAKDTPDNKDDKDMVDKPAMDAAIKLATKETETRVAERFRKLDEAKRLVAPYIGEVIKAYDSANDLLKDALTALKVDVDGVDPSAYPKMLKLVPLPGAKQPRVSIAADSAPAADFAKRFPGADRIGIAS